MIDDLHTLRGVIRSMNEMNGISDRDEEVRGKREEPPQSEYETST